MARKEFPPVAQNGDVWGQKLLEAIEDRVSPEALEENLPERLSEAELSATNARSLANRATDYAGISGWGSSSMAGSGAASTATNVLGRMSTMLGIASAFNGGKGGELVTHHAARAGAVPALVTIASGTIPASGSVDILVENFTDIRLNQVKTYAGTLAGVHGSIAYVSSVLRFTRTNSGSAVRVPTRTPFVPDDNQYRNLFTLLWPGKNTLTETGNSAQVIEYTRLMDAHCGGVGRLNLVLGHFVDSNEPEISAARTAILATNAQYALDYGQRYIDVQGLLTSRYVWYLTGITPTSADIEAQFAGNKPPSLSSDSLHLNDAGYNAVAILCAMRAKDLGWYPNAAIPALPPEPVIPQSLSSTAAPVISGAPTVGGTLTISNGTWSATADSYTYQWKRNGVAITGGTASTYVVQAGDVGTTITATVTAVKAGYVSGSATSTGVTGFAAGDNTLATSDTFSATDRGSITGYRTDAGLGGNMATLTASVAAAVGMAAGKLVRGTDKTSLSFLYQAAPATSEVSIKVDAVSPSGVYLVAARDLVSSPQNQVRLSIRATNFSVENVVAGASTQPFTADYTPGDVLAIRYSGGTITAKKNGATVYTGSSTAPAGGYRGIALAGNNTFSLDDFKALDV